MWHTPHRATDVVTHPTRCSPDSLSAMDLGERAVEDGVNGPPGELSEVRRQKEERGKQDAQKSTGHRQGQCGVGMYRENDLSSAWE